jgi:YD repeat-containing protein
VDHVEKWFSPGADPGIDTPLRTMTSVYNAAGEMVDVTDTDMTSTTNTSYVFNNLGFRTSETNGEGATTAYEYTDFGELEKVDYGNTECVLLGYDLLSRQHRKGKGDRHQI